MSGRYAFAPDSALSSKDELVAHNRRLQAENHELRAELAQIRVSVTGIVQTQDQINANIANKICFLSEELQKVSSGLLVKLVELIAKKDAREMPSPRGSAAWYQQSRLPVSPLAMTPPPRMSAFPPLEAEEDLIEESDK